MSHRWRVLAPAAASLAVGLGMPILELLRYARVSETVVALSVYLTTQGVGLMATGKVFLVGSRAGGSGSSTPGVSPPASLPWLSQSGSSRPGSDGDGDGAGG